MAWWGATGWKQEGKGWVWNSWKGHSPWQNGGKSGSWKGTGKGYTNRTWTCNCCGTTGNWMDRTYCRDCGEHWKEKGPEWDEDPGHLHTARTNRWTKNKSKARDTEVVEKEALLGLLTKYGREQPEFMDAAKAMKQRMEQDRPQTQTGVASKLQRKVAKKEAKENQRRFAIKKLQAKQTEVEECTAWCEQLDEELEELSNKIAELTARMTEINEGDDETDEDGTEIMESDGEWKKAEKAKVRGKGGSKESASKKQKTKKDEECMDEELL